LNTPVSAGCRSGKDRAGQHCTVAATAILNGADCASVLQRRPQSAGMAAEDTDMSDLVVIGFSDEFKADEVRLELMKLQSEYLLDLEDAVVAVKRAACQTVPGRSAAAVPWAVVSGVWIDAVPRLILEAAAGAAAGPRGRAARHRHQRSFHEGARLHLAARLLGAVRLGAQGDA
jgi:hypothetical protein